MKGELIDKNKYMNQLNIDKFNCCPYKIKLYTCVDCNTDYPKIGKTIKCNGAVITKCPWCRIDSEPWRYGRGL